MKFLRRKIAFHKKMSASFLPTIFVPLVGLVFPFVVLGLFFAYIEKDYIY